MYRMEHLLFPIWLWMWFALLQCILAVRFSSFPVWRIWYEKEKNKKYNCVNHRHNCYFIWIMVVILHANCLQNKLHIFAVDYKLHVQMDKTKNLSSLNWKMESQTVKTSPGMIHDVTLRFVLYYYAQWTQWRYTIYQINALCHAFRYEEEKEYFQWSKRVGGKIGYEKKLMIPKTTETAAIIAIIAMSKRNSSSKGRKTYLLTKSSGKAYEIMLFDANWTEWKRKKERMRNRRRDYTHYTLTASIK